MQIKWQLARQTLQWQLTHVMLLFAIDYATHQHPVELIFSWNFAVSFASTRPALSTLNLTSSLDSE